MNFETKTKLINALLACPSMSNRQTRNAIVNDLPGDIKNNITRSDVDRVDVSNIVTTCENYANGLDTLIEIVRVFEGNSIPHQKLDQLWAGNSQPQPQMAFISDLGKDLTSGTAGSSIIANWF